MIFDVYKLQHFFITKNYPTTSIETAWPYEQLVVDVVYKKLFSRGVWEHEVC
jgi:hypothetical protein